MTNRRRSLPPGPLHWPRFTARTGFGIVAVRIVRRADSYCAVFIRGPAEGYGAIATRVAEK
jgi:hypothetical protein